VPKDRTGTFSRHYGRRHYSQDHQQLRRSSKLPRNTDYVLAGSFADSAYFVTRMIRLCAPVGYPVDRRRHKTDGPIVASRVLSIQIADEGGPQAANSDGLRAVEAPGVEARAAVNTPRVSGP